MSRLILRRVLIPVVQKERGRKKILRDENGDRYEHIDVAEVAIPVPEHGIRCLFSDLRVLSPFHLVENSVDESTAMRKRTSTQWSWVHDPRRREIGGEEVVRVYDWDYIKASRLHRVQQANFDVPASPPPQPDTTHRTFVDALVRAWEFNPTPRSGVIRRRRRG